jgi:hypothetical protein
VKIDKLVLLSVVLCAAVLAGELAAYGISPHGYGAEAVSDGDSANVTVSSSGSDTFSVIVADNGTYPDLARLYIYLDERYGETIGDAGEAAGLRDVDIRYAIDQMCRSLRVRGFGDVVICDDERLLDEMLADAGDSRSKGLLVMSYALPESIYSGQETDLLFKWIKEGGRLYWMASPIGMFCRTGDGLAEVENAQELFFGRECVSMDDSGPALSVIDGNGLTNALALKWNRTLYGLNASGIEGSVSMGYSLDGYSSVSMVPFGGGMICVFGGNYERYLCDDAAQVISSGISCYSKVLETRSGTVTRGTAELSFGIPEGTGGISVYVSIGGYYVVFGRCMHVR